jgi:hypothetical protein
MNLTLAETKKLLDNKKYVDGGTTSWREAMAIINQNLEVHNDVCVQVLTPKKIQDRLNLLLNEAQKEVIKDLLKH